ncbi:ABC transporter permease [Microbacterium allomyrinae]|uniref:ABC transporter permease n=1 Tax=Microbacterium allomyrinae TaxID=2830666 RepID=A0A9X1S1C5_9MICO|nr:ABC transporter permease [Microbacterium allomyrinae]MCC2031541.1 ABC transporter permease [Microbacterium allomyrinae]
MRLDTQPVTLLDRVRVFIARRTEGRAVILLVLVGTFAAIVEPVVFTSFQVTLGRVALVGLVALGLTVVILVGELDLSVASTLAVSGVVMASIPDIGLGIVAALVTGVVIGLINAFFVVVVGINSFIATLGMLFALRGLAFVLSNEEPVRLTNIDFGLAFGTPILGPLTPRVLLFFLAFVVLQLFLTRVKSGREFYAVGGNRQAAVDAGIPVKRRLVTAFVISGFVAALAGVINTLERTAADPTAGSTVLLASIAAAIIGGVALTGGRGSILGTLIGAFALGMLQVTLTLSGVQVDVQDIFVGVVLFLAIITDPANLRAAINGLRLSFQGRDRARPPASAS